MLDNFFCPKSIIMPTPPPPPDLYYLSPVLNDIIATMATYFMLIYTQINYLIWLFCHELLDTCTPQRELFKGKQIILSYVVPRAMICEKILPYLNGRNSKNSLQSDTEA